MMSEDQHLSDEELEQLAQVEGGAGAQTITVLAADRQAHASECVTCRERVVRSRNASHRLGQLRGTTGVRTRECLSQADWFEVAAGVRSPGQQETALRHAIACDHCGVLLRVATEVLDQEPKADSETIVAHSESQDTRWQHSMAVRLAESQRTSLQTRKWYLKTPIWALAPIAVIATVAAVLVTQRRGADEAAELIARGYESRRLFELRVPQAAPVPLASLPRGASTDTPGSLHEAFALIDRRLQENPNSPQWLELKGRAEQVSGNLEAAIETFSRALDLAGDDKTLAAGIEGDYAAALSSRAAIEGEGPQRGQDIREAKQHILRAVSLAPDDPVAQFNKALIERQTGEWNNASATLEEFLKRFPKDPWTGEAHRILQELKSKISMQRQSISVSPAEYLERPRLPPEAYLDVALREWLPQLTRAPNSQALRQLANEFEIKYQDRWLVELLDQHQANSGLDLIASAIRANGRGDYSEAIRQSRRAQHMISGSVEPAAYAIAVLQEVYARHLLYQSEMCVDEVSRLKKFLVGYPQFRWVRTQTLLESAICSNFAGQLRQAQQDVHDALDVSQSSGFRIIRLRALGIWAGLVRQQGNIPLTWDLCSRGLQSYWSDWAPAVRAHQFLTEMAASAEADGQWQLAAGLQYEAVKTIETDEDLDYVAMTRFRLARMAEAGGDHVLAADQFRRAEALFASAPDPHTVRVHRLESLIGLAEIQLKLGHAGDCRQKIDAVQPLLKIADPYFLSLHYYEVLGDLELHDQNHQAAAQAYLAGIRIAESALKTIASRSDRLRWMAETEHSYRSLSGLIAQEGNVEGAWHLWQQHTGSFLIGPKGTVARGSFLSAMPAATTPGASSGDILLTFMETGPAIAEWVVQDNQISFRWVDANVDQFNRSAARFTKLCSDPGSDQQEIIRESRRLYDWLLAPVEASVENAKRIVVQPDPMAPDFPFEVLQDSRGQRVIDRFVVSYAPTFETSLLTEEAAINPPHDRLLFLRGANVDSSRSAAAPLYDAEDELQKLKSEFSVVHIVNGRNQNDSRSVAAQLGAADIIHFSGHGIAWLSGSGLLLSSASVEDALLVTPESVDQLQVLRPKKLVFLAACSTARGSERSLLDPNSLVLSFLRSGARAVVASRWAVDSRATAQEAAEFYDEVAKGKSIAEALSVAMTGARLKHSHPYYWAGFSTFGSGRPTARTKEI